MRSAREGEPVVVLLAGFFALTAAAIGVTEWRLRRRGSELAPHGLSGAGAYRMEKVGRVARVTAGRVVRSPWLWLGIVGSVVTVVVEGRPAYPRALMGGWPLPAEIGLFVAVYVVVARQRIDPPQRCAPDGDTRTVGHLLAGFLVALGVGAVSLVNACVWIGPLDAFNGWRPHPLELVQVVTAPVVLAAAAVAAARWWPHPAVSIAVLMVVVMPPFTWALDLYHVTSRAAWEQYGAAAPPMPTGALARHMVFVGGFALLAIGIAVLRCDRRVTIAALPVVGAAAMTIGRIGSAQ